jgi:hypothetical protein
MTRELLILGWFVWNVLPAPAATYHVSVGRGNDFGESSRERPWRTIDRAARTVRPGDTVVLHGGTYRADRFHLGPAGQDARTPTVYQAVPGERVLLTRGDGTPPGFGLADHVRAEGLWVGGR